jgi:hypothetical protein
MAKNLSPEERAKIRTELQSVQDELRELIAYLQRKLQRG